MLQSATLLWCIRPLPQVFNVMDQAWNLLLSVGGDDYTISYHDIHTYALQKQNKGYAAVLE
jgi:hypothetical protein